MADMKKYLDTTALGTLVDQIKAEDAKVLAGAKGYANSLADNYDVAGAAATAESNAKAHAESKVAELAEGQVKLNKEAIEKLNGGAEVEGSVAKAIATAKTEIGADITAVDEKTDKNAEDIAAIVNAETGILKQGKDYTDTEVAKVQEAVDAHEALVGELPEGETSVVAYINKKTEGIATDAALGELQATVTQLGKDVDAVEVDVAAIKGDYLVEADKTELQGNIDTVGAKVDTLVGEDTGKSARTIANEELAKQLIAEGAKESLDTLAEIAAWIQAHPEDAAAMNEAIAQLEALVGTLPEGVTATTIVGYIQEVVAAEKTRAEGVESELSGRIATLEGKFTGEGSVESQIAAALAEAEEYADGVAASEADAAETAAKAHADSLNTAMNTRVEALEAIDHDHSNKAELDLVKSGDVAKWDAASAKAHEHANKGVIDGITAEKVAAWDAAEGNAKTYADGLNTAMNTKVDGAIERVGALETSIATKAETSALNAAVERIAKNETDIAANLSAINSFTAITPEEVNALFA